MQEATELSDLKASMGKKGARQERGPDQEALHHGALASLAAMRAGTANTRMRCGRCEACLATRGTARRCLVNRAAAAAAGGHSGAQVEIPMAHILSFSPKCFTNPQHQVYEYFGKTTLGRTHRTNPSAQTHSFVVMHI